MTLKEIEDAIRASLAANFTEESDMLAWADALKAERERIEGILSDLQCHGCGWTHGTHSPQCPVKP